MSKIIIPFILICCYFNSLSFAHEPSKLRLGGGALPLKANHYRGSDQFSDHYFFLPYFRYKDEALEAETSFIRFTFYENDKFTFKLSINAGFQVESKKNQARMGMADLGWQLEAGPMIIYNLWSSTDKFHVLNFEFPIRRVVATDLSSVKDVGTFSIPYLNYIVKPHERTFDFGFEFSVGPMFADRGYHDFFYEVKGQYARPGRPEYHPKGGYSGFQTALIATRTFDDHYFFMPFIRWDQLSGAAFEDSPLVKTKHYYIIGTGLYYVF